MFVVSTNKKIQQKDTEYKQKGIEVRDKKRASEIVRRPLLGLYQICYEEYFISPKVLCPAVAITRMSN